MVKEKERERILESSEKNLWMGTIQKTLITMMKECEHRPMLVFKQLGSDQAVVSVDDQVFLQGFLSLMEGYLAGKDEYAEQQKQLQSLNTLLQRNISLAEEILATRKMSQVAKDNMKEMLDAFNMTMKHHNFMDIHIVGSKIIDMKQLNSRDFEYYTMVKEYLRGFVFRDLYQLKPEQMPHG